MSVPFTVVILTLSSVSDNVLEPCEKQQNVASLLPKEPLATHLFISTFVKTIEP